MAHNTILVVDDDAVVIHLLHAVLSPSNHFFSAKSGPEALDLIQQGLKPDLILSDLMMPGMTGFELCAQLKANAQTKDIPIIFVTALTHPAQEEEGFKLGAADYITKPIRPELLKARVNLHLELKSYRDSLSSLVESRTNELVDSKKALLAKSTELRYLFETMGELLESRDHYTSEHAVRVAEISVRIGRTMQLDPKALEILELGCLVHDIGKVAIPDDVLLKPGRFDKQDRQIMEWHPLIGAKFFAKRFEDVRLSLIILQHHERLDGTGYPHRAKADEINELAKIVMVADVYEALIARRPYKQPLTRANALDILYQDAAQGKVLTSIVQTLEQVTADWNPLSIEIDFTADYMTVLEQFRRKTYFREPLSDFYNYRYLSSLDRVGGLCKTTDHYHLVMADFNELKELNRKIGYTKADIILDEIGHTFHNILESALQQHSLPVNTLMLLRRGSDYLIYSESRSEIIAQISADCQKALSEAHDKWGIKATLHTSKFRRGQSVNDALEEIYSHHNSEEAVCIQ